jgi:hypothetical protein
MCGPWPRIADRLGAGRDGSGCSRSGWASFRRPDTRAGGHAPVAGYGCGCLPSSPRPCPWRGPLSPESIQRSVPRVFPPGRGMGIRRRSRCFSGGSVKPSAQPTLVRTQHLPPRKIAGQSRFPLRCGSRRGSGPPHRRPARYCVVLAGQRPRPPRGRGTIRCSTANTRRSSGPRHAARRRPIVGQERLRWKTGIRMAVGQSRLAAGSPRAAMTGAGIDRQAPRLSADHCYGCPALSRSRDLPQHRHPARRTPLPTVAIRQTPT